MAPAVKDLEPEYVGADPPPEINPPPPELNIFPPVGLKVPDVDPVPATVPEVPSEKDLANALDVSTDDIVIFPEEAVTPLCIDLIGDEADG